MLRGVIDSPDIPLNVSRSYLQADGAVKKISSYITRKVADKLKSLFNNNREDFEAKWNDIKIVLNTECFLKKNSLKKQMPLPYTQLLMEILYV